jgi:chemotaxis protein CheX
MDVKYIKPFIESVYNLFKTMLHCEPQKVDVKKAEPKIEGSNIVGLIGLSGQVRGTVALIFPKDTAVAITGRFVGMEVTAEDETTTDAVSELVNIVAGAAKAKLSGDGNPISLSLPSVIAGDNSSVLSPSWSTWIDISFNCELGPFNLRLSMELEEKGSEQ